MELEQNSPRLKALGLGVVGVSYDTPAVLKNFAVRKAIHFPLLSDPHSTIIRTLGLLNEAVPKGSPFQGIPHPGVFLLDGEGRVTAKYFEEDFRQRYTAAAILLRQFGVETGDARGEVEGKRLTLTLSATNAAVSAGERIGLVIDMELRPGVHVYAPGVQDYIPIAWTMKDSKGWTAHEVRYPAAEQLNLKAIGETVPAYRGHVRLTREITVANADGLKAAVDASGTLTVEGSLRYQACDDTMCYIPETLPVEWKLKLEALDATRAPVELRRK